MTRETELKFDVPRGCGERLRSAGILDGVEPEERDQAAVYFDTSDGLLRKAGFSLRIRRSGDAFIQTAKHKTDSAAGMFDRQEWECEVPGLELDLAALKQTPLAKLLGKKLKSDLVPLIRTSVRRTTWRLARNGDQIELTLDQGEISGGGSTGAVDEMEVELRRGRPRALFDLAQEIAAVVPLRLGVLSKAERGYAIANGTLGKSAKAEPIRLNPEMTTAQGFASVAYACLRHFRLNEAVLLEKPDPDALHQVRVAMRRLRSSFSLFRSVIADGAFDGLREEIRWFTDQLGEARNLDVLAKRMRGKKGKGEVREKLEEARDAAYRTVAEALQSDRFRTTMLALVRWIEIGKWRSRPKAERPLAPFAARQLGKRWRRIKSEGALLAELDPESRHRLRIDIKKMRYSAEFLAGLQTGRQAGTKRAAFIDALEALQEQLGELNDAVTGRELLGRLPIDAQSGKELFKAPDERRAIASAQEAYRRLVKSADYWGEGAPDRLPSTRNS
jgi:inorganic triphosphatase YgiF